MTTGKLNKRWTLLTILLEVIIITGSLVAWSRYGRSQPIEISISEPQESSPGEIYIGGTVNNPGFYPLEAEDSIEALIQAAGGTTDNADLTNLKLYIHPAVEEQQPQKVDINRVEAWLLQALPGIGEARAQAIIDYREQNGAFQNTYELIKVEGIGTTTYENIKHLFSLYDISLEPEQT